MRTVLAFDFETYKLVGGQMPVAVCMSAVTITPHAATREGWYCAPPVVMLWHEGVTLLERGLREGWEFVGANTAFDVMTAIYNAADPVTHAKKWAAAYRANRVTDVILRQGLLDGAIDFFRRLKRYSLATVTELWTGVKLDKKNPWRLRFGELDDLPVAQYPKEARDYSAEDSWYTAVNWVQQENARLEGSPWRKYFPAHDPLLDEHRQARGALALQDMSMFGLRANPRSVKTFKAHVEREMLKRRDALLEAGLVRKEVSKNTEAIALRYAAAGIEVAATPTGKPSLTKSMSSSSADPALRALQDWPRSSDWLEANAPELLNVSYTRCENVAKARCVLAYWKLNKPLPLSTTGQEKRKNKEPFDPQEYAALDSDACEKSKDPLLKSYSEYVSLAKTLGTDIALLETATQIPFSAHYNTLISSGRTSTGSDGGEGNAGNVQNMPRMPGVRECWVPPPGWVFAEADYSAVELCTFGQVALWLLGWSDCARMINEGIDQHAVIGAEYAKRKHYLQRNDWDWQALKQAIKDGDARADELRTGGKGIGFGRKGGMGAATFVGYAWNNYHLELGETEAEAQAEAQVLIDLHDRIIREMPYYTKAITSKFARRETNVGKNSGRDRVFDLIHPYSGRLRADLGFTDVHNYPFQGLAGDLAKSALFELWCARWGATPEAEQHPLFGTAPSLFGHDSITIACPAERGHDVATGLGKLMTDEARKLLPGCPSIAEAHLCTTLSKKAKPRYDLPEPAKSAPKHEHEAWERNRKLVPWDVWDECRKTASKALTSGKADVVNLTEWLTKDKWPPYVIEDIVNERLAA